jgi:hypothetical protein
MYQDQLVPNDFHHLDFVQLIPRKLLVLKHQPTKILILVIFSRIIDKTTYSFVIIQIFFWLYYKSNKNIAGIYTTRNECEVTRKVAYLRS